ncbi:MAG: hypothetical protein K8R59_07310 [Thermoanaerobaculales bacterium]|nr:hypothetical protein [Thermoanaerobaculales bacterium]
MQDRSLPLVVGLPGHELTRDQRRILERVCPTGVILFARNISDPDQVRDLVHSIGELEPRPFVCIDLEGGVVNRLSVLWGELPTPATAAEAGRRAVKALGLAAGAACRALGIHLDLAPVIDLERPEGLIALQGRTLSDSADRSAVLARVFFESLAVWSVGACLKHFPGLGPVPVDTHEVLPVLDHRTEDLDEHMGVFAALSAEVPVVMVGHVVAPLLGDGERPASLSRQVVQLAIDLPGRPIVLSDDLEMGALKSLGDLPDLVVAALRARNHGVLVCRAFDRLEEIAENIEAKAAQDPIFASSLKESRARMTAFAHDLCRESAAVPQPDDTTVAQLWEKARREVDAKGPAGNPNATR